MDWLWIPSYLCMFYNKELIKPMRSKLLAEAVLGDSLGAQPLWEAWPPMCLHNRIGCKVAWIHNSRIHSQSNWLIALLTQLGRRMLITWSTVRCEKHQHLQSDRTFRQRVKVWHKLVTLWRCSNNAFLPARRYAIAGLCYSNVSVRPSCAGIVSKRRKLASWFLHHLVAPRL